MSVDTSLTLLLLFSIAGFCFSIWRRARVWRQGRDDVQQNRWSDLLTIPKRYFVDLHHIVARDKQATRMHVSFAGAMVALLLLFAAVSIWQSTFVLKALITLALIVAAYGTVMLFARRRAQPSYLSYGRYRFTAIASSALLLSLLWIVWGGGTLMPTVIAALALLVLFWAGAFHLPLKHIVSGAFHLAFHPRAERFAGALSSGLKAEPSSEISKENATAEARAKSAGNVMDTANAMGKAFIKDFSWQQLLSFDACIECGRCEKACPAFASNQPLNPKKLIQDLYLLSRNQNDTHYSGSPHPKKQANAHTVNAKRTPIDAVIDNNTLYACTTCRACVYECPMMIEHVDAIVSLRRHQTMSKGALPEKAAQALVNLRQTDNVGGYRGDKRHQWASDLAIEQAQPNETYDVLLLCGEAGFELRSQKSLRDFVGIANKAGVRLALLPDETDTGDLARRLGDEVLFERLARQMINTLSSVNFKTIVTLDPHIYNSINNEYPALGGNFAIEHASSYLHRLIVVENKLSLTQTKQRLTYHDPCYLGRYNNVVDAPRALLEKMGVEINEMERSKMRSRCCGWGGGSAYSDIAGDTRIPDMRMDDVRQTGCDTVVVGCPNCMTMLEGVVEPRAQVIDVVSLVAKAVEEANV